jgi:hypothetical protein
VRFWENPEFVRHARAELRPARALTAAVLALVICGLVGLSSWGSTERNNPQEFFKVFYLWIMGMQFVVLTFWCASACGHAISREREMKTYDFLKTTRLTTTELMVGQVLGVPILAYFTVGCTVPVSVLLGILAAYPLGTIFWTYVLLVALALFVSVTSLWASMQLEGTSARSIGLLVIVPIAFGFGFADSAFPGFGAISVFPALLHLYKANADIARVTPTFYGRPVSFVFLTLILYASLGAWFALMLRRNLKKDIEQIRLLSRWQAIGFAIFLNMLFYAFLDPARIKTPSNHHMDFFGPAEVSIFAVLVNALILFIVGIAMLSPHEQLKVWWRKHAAGESHYLSETGPPWPWLMPAALTAYALLVAEALGLRGSIAVDQWHLDLAAVQLLVCLVFVTGDILFLQWIALMQLKRPVTTGIFYLVLYYTAAGILTSVLSIVSPEASVFLLGLLTPSSVLVIDSNPVSAASPSVWPGIYAGLVVQVGVILLLLRIVSVRLSRPAVVPVLSEA